MAQHFLDSYFEFAQKTVAVPPLFNKWAGVMGVACMLGKRLFIRRGHLKVYPNLYVMLMGEPGTGKGVACDILQTILTDAGYGYFAADRSSKEKFLSDLADGINFNAPTLDSLLGAASFSDQAFVSTEPRECFILAEEFSDFLGQNNPDFVAFLTKVWSYSGTYKYRIKTGKSVGIYEPYINILGGSSSAAFALTFPPEIIAQGFLARMVLVAGESPRKRKTFPDLSDPIDQANIAEQLIGIKVHGQGEITITEKAFADLDSLNQEFGGVDDPRFRDYNVRRFTQLLKICIICCAARGKDLSLRVEDVERAHDLLCETEHSMPRALGSFGKSRNSDVSNKLLATLYSADRPISTMALWRIVCDDLEKLQDLSDLLHKLSSAGRIQSAKGSDGVQGWLIKIDPPKEKFEINIMKPGEAKK